MCNVPDTATNRSCSLILRGTGKSKPQVTLSLKNVTTFTDFFEFLVAGPVSLVQYTAQLAKDNKIPSILPLTAVEIFPYDVPIYISSRTSHDAPPASLLVLGLCFQTLRACIEAVGCICRLTQVGEWVANLCSCKSLH